MKLSISNIAWEKEINIDVYKIMEKYGFSGLEIAPTKTFGNIEKITQNEINIFTNEIKKYGLKCIAMQSLLFGKKYFNIFSNNNDEILKYLEKLILLGSKLGIKSLIFGSPKNRIYKGITKEEAIEKARIFFSKLGNIAYNEGVFICIEPNPAIYGGNFMFNTKETLEFVKYINKPAIKLHIDLGTIIYNNENLEIIKEGLPYITHFHISEIYLELIKDRKEHYKIAKLLKNFKGFCSIEMKNTSIKNIENTLKLISKIYK